MVSALGFSDKLSLAQTVGIVGTMVLTLYFSKKQVQSLSIDTQTRGLDLGEKFFKIVGRAPEDKSIQGVLNNEPDKWFNPDIQNFLNTEVVAGK